MQIFSSALYDAVSFCDTIIKSVEDLDRLTDKTMLIIKDIKDLDIL